jgi:hypothetical protein
MEKYLNEKKPSVISMNFGATYIQWKHREDSKDRIWTTP